MYTTERYVPAAGRAWLTRLYDPVMALSMRERSFRAALVDCVLVEQPALVLDVGCGTGTLAASLLQANPLVRILGIDGDPQVLDRARTKTARFADRASFVHGQADSLPIPDGSTDAVIASLLLHHLAREGKLRALAEAHRVLRTGGRLMVADWGRPHDPLMRSAFLALQLLDGFANTRDHAAGKLPALIAQAGFCDVAVTRRWRTLWGSLEMLTATRADPA
jgi:ubiquinone/menaquinone biosynthesis C-methylase UbiE